MILNKKDITLFFIEKAKIILPKVIRGREYGGEIGTSDIAV